MQVRVGSSATRPSPIPEQELAWTAPVKAVAMVLIVLYHSCALWLPGGWLDTMPREACAPLGVFVQWLNTLHVPCFVFVSGYLYSYLKRETDRYGSPRAVISKKVRRLLVPYAFVCLAWAAPLRALAFGLGGLVPKYLLVESPSQLWFLVMLFDLFCLFELLDRLSPGILSRRGHMVFALGLVWLVGTAFGSLVGTYFQFASAAAYAPVFYAGWVAREAGTERLRGVSLPVVLAVDLAVFAVWLQVRASDALVARAAAIALTLVLRLVGGWLLWVFATGLLVRFPRLCGGGMLKRYSFGVYLFHQQVVYAAAVGLDSVGAPVPACVAAAFCAGLGVALAISCLLSRFPATRQLIGG